MPHLQRVALITVLVVLLGCEEKPAQSDRNDTAPSTSASSDAGPGDTTSDDAAASGDAVAAPDGATAEAEPTAIPASPLVPARTVKQVESELGGEVYGTLSGQAFGNESKVYGVARMDCGEGTVLQPFFRRKPDAKLEVMPPIPLQFYNLATKRPVSYDEDEFRITVDFEEDSPERLAGEVKISFTQLGGEVVYAHLVYDGPPTKAVIPPRLAGSGNLPTYPNCFPTGYFSLEDEDGIVQQGLVRIVDVEKKNVPFARILLGPDNAFQLMVVTRDSKGIDPAQTVELAKARRTSGNMGILFDVQHRPELIDPTEAIGANLGTLQESKMVDGLAHVRIARKRGQRVFDTTFEGVRVSSILGGPLSGRSFERLRIYGVMVPADAMPLDLPDPPDWYRVDNPE